GAGQDHDADGGVVARLVERADHLGDGLRPERVAHLGPLDRDLRDAVGRGLVGDVLVAGAAVPGEVGHGAPLAQSSIAARRTSRAPDGGTGAWITVAPGRASASATAAATAAGDAAVTAGRPSARATAAG